MAELTIERLAASAYRTLGLSGAATQAQIDAAARRLRIWPDSESIPPTSWDLPWLGPISRSRNDIEQALASLNEPGLRIEERLLWFHGSDPALLTRATLEQARAALASAAARDPASVHDVILIGLAAALRGDPGCQDAEPWGRVLRSVASLTKSQTYVNWTLGIECQGEFEKQARAEEIVQIIGRLPGQLATSLATGAARALEDDDLAAAARIFAVLTSGGPELGAAWQPRTLDRLEDLLNSRCLQLNADLQKRFQKSGAPLPAAYATCISAAKFYNESIEPVLTCLYQLAGPESDRTRRARTSAARAMEYLGRCWGACYRYPTAEQTLQAALQLAAGTPAERTVVSSLERIRASAKQKHPKGSAAAGTRRSWFNVSLRLTPKAWVAVMVLVGLGRFLASLNSPHDQDAPGGNFGQPTSGNIYYTPDGHPHRSQSPYTVHRDDMSAQLQRMQQFHPPRNLFIPGDHPQR